MPFTRFHDELNRSKATARKLFGSWPAEAPGIPYSVTEGELYPKLSYEFGALVVRWWEQALNEEDVEDSFDRYPRSIDGEVARARQVISDHTGDPAEVMGFGSTFLFWSPLRTAAQYADRAAAKPSKASLAWDSFVEAAKDAPGLIGSTLGKLLNAAAGATGDAARNFLGGLGAGWILVGVLVLAWSRR